MLRVEEAKGITKQRKANRRGVFHSHKGGKNRKRKKLVN